MKKTALTLIIGILGLNTSAHANCTCFGIVDSPSHCPEDSLTIRVSAPTCGQAVGEILLQNVDAYGKIIYEYGACSVKSTEAITQDNCQEDHSAQNK